MVVALLVQHSLVEVVAQVVQHPVELLNEGFL
jgi:hypothetical protein